MLAGLRDKLMAPEVAAEAVRAFVAETNRLNHERSANSAADKLELSKAERSISGILDAIEDGRRTPALMARLCDLEDRVAVLRAQQTETSTPTIDLHPNIAETYRKKVSRLAEALNQPADRDEATTALRGLIDTVVLTPGTKRGEMHATLHGEFGVILDWLEDNSLDPKRQHPRRVGDGGVVIVGCGSRI